MSGLRGFADLPGFRNVLAHDYLDLDLGEVVRSRARLLTAGSRLIAEIEEWVEGLQR